MVIGLEIIQDKLDEELLVQDSKSESFVVNCQLESF